MRCSSRRPLFAAAVLLSLWCGAAATAAPRRAVSSPVSERLSPIGYVGGRRSHALVWFDRIKDSSAKTYTQRTPRGAVTVYWRRDDGKEDGGPPPADGEITHPDAVYRVVVVSPSLRVDFVGAFGLPDGYEARWVRLNGVSVPLQEAPGLLRLPAGKSVIVIGFPDIE